MAEPCHSRPSCRWKPRPVCIDGGRLGAYMWSASSVATNCLFRLGELLPAGPRRYRGQERPNDCFRWRSSHLPCCHMRWIPHLRTADRWTGELVTSCMWGEQHRAVSHCKCCAALSTTHCSLHVRQPGRLLCIVINKWQAVCWGQNTFGQCGDGDGSNPVQRPSLVAGGHIFKQIAAGRSHTCGIRASDSRAMCWGK